MEKFVAAVGVVFLLALCAVSMADVPNTPTPTSSSVSHETKTPPLAVAIADVHGAFDRFVHWLQKLEIVDSELHWSANNTILIQTGDVVDRGPRSRSVIELLMRLQDEAARVGGRVICLWGNHETMQLFANLDYADPKELEEYTRASDRWDRDEYLAQINELFQFLKQSMRLKLQSRYYKDLLFDFLSHVPSSYRGRSFHPDVLSFYFKPGYFKHRAEWTEGRIARWLLDATKHPVAAVVDDTLFVHAGLHVEYTQSFATVDDLVQQFQADAVVALNLTQRCVELRYCHSALGFQSLHRLVRVEYAAGSRGFQHLPKPVAALFDDVLAFVDRTLLLDMHGPVWYRGLVSAQNVKRQLEFKRTLHHFGVSTMIVGHTITPDFLPRLRFAGRLVQLDCAMFDWTRGRPAAAVFHNATSGWECVAGQTED